MGEGKMSTADAVLDIARQVMEAAGCLWSSGLEWTAGSIVLRCDGQGVWHVYDTSKKSAGGWIGGASSDLRETRKAKGLGTGERMRWAGYDDE